MDKPINILIDDTYFYRWQGGKNYLLNIALKMKSEGFVLHRLKQAKAPKNTDVNFDFEYEEGYPQPISFDRVLWKMNRGKTWRKLNPWIKNIDISFQIRNNDIQSHVKSIRWIPDFQHIEMPELFSVDEINKRNIEFEQFAKDYDITLLSSYHAQNIFNELYPFAASKSRVYQFEVSIPAEVYSITNEYILEKYNLPDKYIHFPSQWWKHKNHRFIFEVMRNVDDPICLVCTGKEDDYRNPEYSVELKEFVKNHNLSKKIRLLGEVPYSEMLAIMRFSNVVINPSSYEGWSTTVEEAKLFGKSILCLDTAIFREQLEGYTNRMLIKNDSNHWADIIFEFFEKKAQQNNSINSKKTNLKNLFQ
ncbi:glycosyltransferase [bacterium]|nr:MAG: glycosyltransferase [bacterium]